MRIKTSHFLKKLNKPIATPVEATVKLTLVETVSSEFRKKL